MGFYPLEGDVSRAVVSLPIGGAGEVVSIATGEGAYWIVTITNSAGVAIQKTLLASKTTDTITGVRYIQQFNGSGIDVLVYCAISAGDLALIADNNSGEVITLRIVKLEV